ncbi:MULTISPECIES: glycosyltransferase 87 family protein [unclassified Arthrobacter]|uniref:glycosyltransferase 87 family protein n=1 Tax=unclassified Arthrobacter TaxID=235627 RepID=UPI002E0BD555|nr:MULTISPECIES: glycosyltransferase 87 family protein [unclassified Arthrobacter]MEC5190056.1 alpha-1,2-mannosyltransferase [Arthrobacter sp. MP_M4]MEC5201524.1 alpha-1,2-mannosyltransferase [Arthrobacter sp. MP_M7]
MPPPEAETRPIPVPVTAEEPAGEARPGRTFAWVSERLYVPQLLQVSTVLALAGLIYLVWHWLGVWGAQGLDFSVYWYGGTILNEAGQAPSDLYRGNIDWAGGPQLPFTYPPFAALLFSLLARVPQGIALTLFNAAGAGVALWVAVRGVRYWNAAADWRTTFQAPGNRWAAAVLVLAVLNLGPWRETLAFGQINILLMGMMALDLLARNQRWMVGFPGSGFLVGIAAGIKLTPLVFGLYFLVRKDWRGLFNMGAGFACTVVLGWLVRPAESLEFWFQILPDTSRIGGAGYVDNLSLKGALLHFGVPEASVTFPWLALSMLVVVLAARIIKAASDQGARVVAVSTTALAMLLISPVSWSHHWVWVAAVLPAFAWTLRETPHRYRGLRWLMGGVLGVSVMVFLFSPKTIGTALGAEDLNVQTPGLWIMASSAGVFCAVAILVCWLMVLRRGAVTPAADLDQDGERNPAETALRGNRPAGDRRDVPTRG